MISYKVPCDNGKVREERGRVAYFKVNGKRIKFALQLGRDGRKADALVHYASGYRVGRLDAARVRAMCERGHHARLTSRQAAEYLLDGIVARFGEANVLAKIEAAPVINND